MAGAPSAKSSSRALRRDAASNRARIVEAAGTVFADHGFDVPLADIAAAAGVGLATLTRHFNRTQLVYAVAEQRLDAHLRIVQDALALPPMESLDAYLRTLCERRLADRSLCHTFTLRMPESAAVARLREAIRQAQAELIDAGRRAGTLRDDLVPQDLLLVLEAVSGVIDATSGDAAWQRILAIIMAALAPAAEPVALPDPPAPDELLESLNEPPRGRRTTPVGASR